jgi:twitching motility protein PilT
MKFFSKFKNFQKESSQAEVLPFKDETFSSTVDMIARDDQARQEEQRGETEPELILPAPPPISRQTIDLGMETITLQGLLSRMVELGASDLHLESGSPPIYRIKGDIVFATTQPLSTDLTGRFIFSIINEAQKKTFMELGNLDFCYEIPDLARFRANYLRHNRGMGGVFRFIPNKIPSIEQLNLPGIIKTISMSRKGIILVTGPTGSGKSTTMAAMINYINQNRKGHIITIEDPIEFSHESINCLITHREVGHHTRSFADALKAALREDPDVILVGEMRDLETISLALTAAQMGVLVMGTLHTNSATKTIDRMIDVFPAKQQEQVRLQLSQSLRAIIAQQLLKTADGRGRVAALEILRASTGLANIIREGKTTQIGSCIQMGKSEGMQAMDNVLVDLVKAGKISKEAALERAYDLSVMKRAGLL